ncbi:MAG: transcription termination/antitermination protein NusA [Deltaproteobacteria bacterium]|nr:transcription termination/antitermination protein NusA [Deltaproteobacteria bacterium]
MTVNQELMIIFAQLEREKGIDQESLVEAIEAALVTAARKVYGSGTDMFARMDRQTGRIEIYQRKEVALQVGDPSMEISLLDARQLDPHVMPGDEVEIEIDANEFGRIAAQTAKQVIVQKLREAEREMIFKNYSGRVGEIINGIVHGFSRGAIIVDLGKTEAEIPAKEQVPRERYKQGDRIKAYILEVKQVAKGPQVVLSRSSLNFLLKLFDLEVPEVAEGIVEIRSAAREPGARSKIAVVSHDPNVDPVGACVGVKGSRVQAVVNELRGERIDIIPWVSDPALFVSSSLSPAQVTRVIINEADKSMGVIVADEELSLAIGRNGQNVRLAARLTNWNITIKSESQAEAEKLEKEQGKEGPEDENLFSGISAKIVDSLKESGFGDAEAIRNASDKDLLRIPGLGPKTLERLRERAEGPEGDPGN